MSRNPDLTLFIHTLSSSQSFFSLDKTSAIMHYYHLLDSIEVHLSVSPFVVILKALRTNAYQENRRYHD